MAAGQRMRNSRARPISRSALMPMRPTTRGKQPERLAGELAEIDVHADGEEEHAEQQPLEGLDGGLDRLAELGLGQQQPGDERSERHRKAGEPARPRLPTITNKVAATNSSLVPVEATRRNSGLQQQPADNDDDADRQRGIGQREHETGHDRAAGACAEDGDEQQDRHHRQVLGQQNGEARPAGGGREATLVGEHLDDDGGRRQGEARAENDGSGGLVAANSAATPPITAVDRTTCRPPSPNTRRRMVRRRW